MCSPDAVRALYPARSLRVNAETAGAHSPGGCSALSASLGRASCIMLVNHVCEMLYRQAEGCRYHVVSRFRNWIPLAGKVRRRRCGPSGWGVPSGAPPRQRLQMRVLRSLELRPANGSSQRAGTSAASPSRNSRTFGVRASNGRPGAVARRRAPAESVRCPIAVRCRAHSQAPECSPIDCRKSRTPAGRIPRRRRDGRPLDSLPVGGQPTSSTSRSIR